MVPTNKNGIFIVTLLVILLSLLSYAIYSRFNKKEGFGLDDIGKFFKFIPDIFNNVRKIIEFIGKVNRFFCWLGDVVEWCINTVAALIYYVGNIFTGCILFYWFDMVMGTIWYILYIFFSIIRYGKEFSDISKEISEWMDAIDDTFYEWTDMHLFKYSDETTKKCYKLKFEDFPKWPF
jgi:phage-related minor tail protein